MNDRMRECLERAVRETPGLSEEGVRAYMKYLTPSYLTKEDLLRALELATEEKEHIAHLEVLGSKLYEACKTHRAHAYSIAVGEAMDEWANRDHKSPLELATEEPAQ